MVYFPEEKVRAVFSREYGEIPLSVRRIEQGVDNANYTVVVSGAEYLFKIYRKRNVQDIQFELALLQYLEEIKFPCPRIILTRRGDTCVFFGNKPAVLFRYISGAVGGQMPKGGLYTVGAQLAAVHSIGRDFPLRPQKEDWMWEPQNVGQYIALKSKHIIEKNYPAAHNFVLFVAQEFRTLSNFEGLPSGITHQDVKQENVVIDTYGTIHFIDFDLSYRGTLLIDLATPIIWFCFTNDGEFLNEKAFELLRGYSSIRGLVVEEKKLFFDALRFRLLRESFAWPMKFAPEIARKHSNRFLNAYRVVTQSETKKQIIEMVYSLSL